MSVRCIKDTLVEAIPGVTKVVVNTSELPKVKFSSIVGTDGGSEVVERGFCWNTTGKPTIADNILPVGKGLGSFESFLEDLSEEDTYYVCAYAKNNKGTAYSEVVPFKICPASFDIYHIEGFNGAPETKKVSYHSVTSNITGKPCCWLTQNLGADRQALSYDDNTEESAGWYWKFYNNQLFKHDGHSRYPSSEPWVKWINYSYYTSSNDPCIFYLGSGWRLPTNTEWGSVYGFPQSWKTPQDAYNSVLKLHLAGYLLLSQGI